MLVAIEGKKEWAGLGFGMNFILKVQIHRMSNIISFRLSPLVPFPLWEVQGSTPAGNIARFLLNVEWNFYEQLF